MKSILKKIVPEDAGVIIRTAAEGATEEELTRDVERLTAQWTAIQEKARAAEVRRRRSSMASQTWPSGSCATSSTKTSTG